MKHLTTCLMIIATAAFGSVALALEDDACSFAPTVAGAYVASHSLTTLRSPDGNVVAKTAIAIYTCSQGKLIGDAAIHCRNGQWLEQPPTCLLKSTIPLLTTKRVRLQPTLTSPSTPRSPAPRRISMGPCKYNLPSTHALCLEFSSPNFTEKASSPQEQILSAHNYWRQNVSPLPKRPLPPLRWDEELAEMAERWAAQCSIEHTPAELRELPERGSNKQPWSWVGQNIFMVYGFSPDWSWAINHWAEERKNWKYGVGVNGSGIVGHYTQIIWQSTRYLGCGRASCQGKKHIFVCNYGPGGNVGIKGRNPYAWPYIASTYDGPENDDMSLHSSDDYDETDEASNSGNGEITEGRSNSDIVPRGPQCKYGMRPLHAFCLDDSEFLIGFERSPQDEIVNRHNYWRDAAHIMPPPKTPLPQLKWDADLATMAERWAAQCKMEHDDSENRRMPARGVNGSAWQWVGQNICYSWSYSMSWAECVNSWAEERDDWEYGVGQVGSGAAGHYTQLIWADTLFVGCGKAHCKGGAVEYIMVCNYGPGGNVGWNGADPYARPYVASIKEAQGPSQH